MKNIQYDITPWRMIDDVEGNEAIYLLYMSERLEHMYDTFYMMDVDNGIQYFEKWL